LRSKGVLQVPHPKFALALNQPGPQHYGDLAKPASAARGFTIDGNEPKTQLVDQNQSQTISVGTHHDSVTSKLQPVKRSGNEKGALDEGTVCNQEASPTSVPPHSICAVAELDGGNRMD
jgi:hypothetical protein